MSTGAGGREGRGGARAVCFRGSVAFALFSRGVAAHAGDVVPPACPEIEPRRLRRRGAVECWAWWGALFAVVTAVWLTFYDRWSPASWAVPPHYAGDSLEILARMVAASEGDALPPWSHTVRRLGAPFGADWTEYPASDRVLMAALGAVAALVGWPVAANLALWLATVTAALAFYGCARFLRHDRAWAWAGAVAFAFTYQAFGRGLPHLLMAFSWTVPVSLLVCWLVGSGRVALRRARVRWGLGAASVALGVSNPYVLFLWGQLVVLALLARWAREGFGRQLVPGAAVLALAALAFVLLQADYFLHGNAEGGPPLLSRNYGGTERYALKPIELVVPPAEHRWAALGFFGQRYLRWSDWRGETFMPYLGVFGVLALLGLGLEVLVRAARGQRLAAHGLQSAWVVLFSSVGGLTNVLALFAGVQVFRATNRYSLFLSALVLFWAVSRLSRWTRGWPAVGRMGVAALVAALAVLDQVPPRQPHAAELAEAVFRSDQAFGRELEAMLPAGAMVFQLPVLEFPETVAPVRLGDYAHFRPYLHTRHLRYSYGALKGRARGRWQHDADDYGPLALVRELEAAGFAAIQLNRDGFYDDGEAWIEGFAAAGRPVELESPRGDLVVVGLQPASEPRPPLARGPVYGRGWHRPEDSLVDADRRWAWGNAVLSYHNPDSVPLRVSIGMNLRAQGARTVEVWHAGRVLARETFAADGVRRVEIGPVALAPGINRIDLRTDHPAERRKAGRGGLRAFAVADLEWRIERP
jgi:hypothetical protein